ncbi:Tautomerase/MIF superfamily [Mycena crocata]|nr:Tautomerase/MIF superfamily [Mycena crocata]
MPYLELLVNVEIPEETEFALEFSKVSAKTLGKPEEYITVSVTYSKTLTFAGSLDPAFALSITSLDNLNPEANEKYSAKLSEFFQDRLGIPNDRGYMSVISFRGSFYTAKTCFRTFHDPGRANLGFKGTTFATIFAK